MLPRPSVWLIRLAMVHLLVGLGLGSALLVHKGTGAAPWAWALLPAHIECVAVGWTVQFVLGVAYWMLPRWDAPPLRGPEGRVWAAAALVNAGVALFVAGAALSAPAAMAAGRLFEAAAIGAFLANAWPRIKRFGPVR